MRKALQKKAMNAKASLAQVMEEGVGEDTLKIGR